MKLILIKYRVLAKLLLVAFVLPLFAFNLAHKYYVSVTEIEYVKEERSLQIITRIFIDDIEKLLRERYDESITLAGKTERSTINYYVEKYLKEKITISIDGEAQQLNYIGKEYEDDIMFCYLEIVDVKAINTMEVSNKVLFELFNKQQNIIKTKIKTKNKSFILIKENPKGLLNFN